MTDQPDRDALYSARLDATFRNGSVTAVGIVLGFTLNFFSAWVNNSSPWHPSDLFALTPLVAGAGCQMRALAGLMSLSSLELPAYNRCRNIFIAGLLLVVLGIAVSVAMDAFGIGTKPPG